MNDNNYILAGVVSYHQYASDKNNRHYTAFVYDTQWYLYDDMMIKRKTASDDEEVALHLIIYTMVHRIETIQRQLKTFLTNSIIINQ